MTMGNKQVPPAPLGPVERVVGRPVEERDDFYYDDASEPDEPVCAHCHGDGFDPMTDYLLPCWACQKEQRP
jgi:hypothetical protein